MRKSECDNHKGWKDETVVSSLKQSSQFLQVKIYFIFSATFHHFLIYFLLCNNSKIK